MVPIELIVSVMWLTFIAASIWGVLTKNLQHAVIAERLCVVTMLPVQWYLLFADSTPFTLAMIPVFALTTGWLWCRAERNWKLFKQRQRILNGK